MISVKIYTGDISRECYYWACSFDSDKAVMLYTMHRFKTKIEAENNFKNFATLNLITGYEFN
jgi:hypothetical protein